MNGLLKLGLKESNDSHHIYCQDAKDVHSRDLTIQNSNSHSYLVMVQKGVVYFHGIYVERSVELCRLLRAELFNPGRLYLASTHKFASHFSEQGWLNCCGIVRQQHNNILLIRHPECQCVRMRGYVCHFTDDCDILSQIFGCL